MVAYVTISHSCAKWTSLGLVKRTNSENLGEEDKSKR